MGRRLLIISLVLVSFQAIGQEEKFQFNGSARAYVFSNDLDIDQDLDSVTTRKANYGQTLLDLGISIFPNKKTEVIGMFRIRNELGGFWGGGTSFNVRQLTLKGVAGNVVKYEIGDIDLEMTPYTLFNFQEEGIVNEAEAFKIRRDVVHYDLFYNGNTWRMQGAKTKFGLNFSKGIKSIDVTSFITRQRPALLDPERLYGGGTIKIEQSKNLAVSFNSVANFDLSQTVADTMRHRNGVHTMDVLYKYQANDNNLFTFRGEGGFSEVVCANCPDINGEDGPLSTSLVSGSFIDISVKGENKKMNLSYEVGFKDVQSDFLSPGAQTKRVDYGRFPALYQQITNDAQGRRLNYTDVISGNTSNSIQISEELVPYFAAYNNTTPYGDATPNRKGVYINVNRKDTVKFKKAFFKLGVFEQSQATGSDLVKSFILAEAGTDVFLSDFLNWKREFKINAGIRYEATNRGGEEFESVDLSSTLIDLGLSLEFADKLDLLVGAKLWNVNGNAFINERNIFNVIKDYDVVSYDFTENTIATGLRYRFNDKNVLSAQYQTFNLDDSITDAVDYGMSQLTLLFNMKF